LLQSHLLSSFWSFETSHFRGLAWRKLDPIRQHWTEWSTANSAYYARSSQEKIHNAAGVSRICQKLA